MHLIKITYNRTATHFMDVLWTRRRGNSDFALNQPSTSQLSDCMFLFISLSSCYWTAPNAEFCASCVCLREREEKRVTNPPPPPPACLQTHTRFISCPVHTTLFLVQAWNWWSTLRTLLPVFNLVLKAEACDYGKGALHFRFGLCCSANHNALCQLANQSRLRLSEGGTL